MFHYPYSVLLSFLLPRLYPENQKNLLSDVWRLNQVLLTSINLIFGDDFSLGFYFLSYIIISFVIIHKRPWTPLLSLSISFEVKVFLHKALFYCCNSCFFFFLFSGCYPMFFGIRSGSIELKKNLNMHRHLTFGHYLNRLRYNIC